MPPPVCGRPSSPASSSPMPPAPIAPWRAAQPSARRCSSPGSFRPMDSLADVAPAFVEMAHRIVWCTVATTGADGHPHTRVLHPIWEWDGTALDGVDRHLAALAQGARPRRCPGRRADLLGADPRHLHGRVRRRVRGRTGRAPGRLGSLRQRTCAGGLRPGDHPGVDGPAGRGVRHPAPHAAVVAAEGRHCHDPGLGSAVLTGRAERREVVAPLAQVEQDPLGRRVGRQRDQLAGWRTVGVTASVSCRMRVERDARRRGHDAWSGAVGQPRRRRARQARSVPARPRSAPCGRPARPAAMPVAGGPRRPRPRARRAR